MVPTRMLLFVTTLAFLLIQTPAEAAEVKIATFNTESDLDTDPTKVAETISEVQGVDIWALQEVQGLPAIEKYLPAAKISGHGEWRFVISESGASNNPTFIDYTAILYRRDIFRQLETVELHAIRSRPKEGSGYYGTPSWGLREALFLRLEHRETGQVFWIGNVHLKCCADGAEVRTHQTRILGDWIKRQSDPVLLLGDLNIPVEPGLTAFEVKLEAFDILTDGSALVWLAPLNPIKTQCDPRFNSMLDMVFYSRVLAAWKPSARIEFEASEYCEKDALGYADHRPIVVTLEVP